MNLDGIIFVNACFRDSASKLASTNKFISRICIRGPEDYTHNGDGTKTPFSVNIKSGSKRIAKPLTSDLLGCKVRNHHASTELDEFTDITISYETLRRLMTCYSQGQMFFCLKDGSLNIDLEPEPFEICTNGNVEPDREIVADWVAELIKVCPGA